MKWSVALGLLGSVPLFVIGAVRILIGIAMRNTCPSCFDIQFAYGIFPFLVGLLGLWVVKHMMRVREAGTLLIIFGVFGIIFAGLLPFDLLMILGGVIAVRWDK